MFLQTTDTLNVCSIHIVTTVLHLSYHIHINIIWADLAIQLDETIAKRETVKSFDICRRVIIGYFKWVIGTICSQKTGHFNNM